MHKLNVLIFGPSSFISTLDELKSFLKFNPFTNTSSKEHDVILIHHEALKDKNNKNFIEKSNTIKIYASNKRKSSNDYDAYLELPANLKEINSIVYLNKATNSVKVNELQSKVWSYQSELETHTVETHIHRLRKKILSNFNLDNLIASKRDGHYLKLSKNI